MNFFNKLPTITYNGNLARNIMARAKLSDTTKANSRLFFPYTTSGDERVDNLSNQYYGNPGYTWLIWFANETIDPYYDMALSQYELEQFIATKYGSIAKAQRGIKHFKINWEDETSGISINVYESLERATQKYWEPVLDYNLNVKGYVRKKDDQYLNTNRVGTYKLTNIIGEFVLNEEVQIQNDSTAYGFVTHASGTALTAQHLSGLLKVGQVVIGKESGATATIIEANNFAATTAAYDDSRYWKPVSFYDYEVDLNEKKKEIVLMDAARKNQAEQELIRVMNR